MYKIEKLTMAERVSIPVNAVVQLNVNESLSVPDDNYAIFYIRKYFAMKGVSQLILSPFKSGWVGKPFVTVKNNSLSEIEILKNEEIGEIWIYD